MTSLSSNQVVSMRFDFWRHHYPIRARLDLRMTSLSSNQVVSMRFDLWLAATNRNDVMKDQSTGESCEAAAALEGETKCARFVSFGFPTFQRPASDGPSISFFRSPRTKIGQRPTLKHCFAASISSNLVST